MILSPDLENRVNAVKRCFRVMQLIAYNSVDRNKGVPSASLLRCHNPRKPLRDQTLVRLLCFPSKRRLTIVTRCWDQVDLAERFRDIESEQRP